jgi:amino acid transporter
MFGREKRFARDDAANGRTFDDGGNVAVAERERTDDRTAVREPARAERGNGATAAAGTAALGHEARMRQRDRFGGCNWGAAFFGWLVALGMGVILTAIVAAAGAALGLTQGTSTTDAQQNADTIGIVGGALLIAISFLAYYCGGYVAGRMSRFDGGRQGFGVWALGLIVTLVVAAAGAIFGDQYNVFEKLDLPRIPLSASELTTGGAITLAAIVVATLIGAILGGKLGERYHRRVDRAAIVD